MIPVLVVSKVEIPPIKEDVIANLIKAEILKDNPTLVINSISFERKLSPQRTEAVVEASLAGSVSTPTMPEKEETLPAVKEEFQETLPLVEKESVLEPDPKPLAEVAKTVAKRKKVFT